MQKIKKWEDDSPTCRGKLRSSVYALMARDTSADSVRDEGCMVLSGNNTLFNKMNKGTITATCMVNRNGSIKYDG